MKTNTSKTSEASCLAPELSNCLSRLGIAPDAQEKVAELSAKIEILNRSHTNKFKNSVRFSDLENTNAFLTYDYLDGYFRNCRQKWSELKDLIRGSIWKCDLKKSFLNKDREKNKAYCYNLSEEFRSILYRHYLGKYLVFSFDPKRRKKKFENLKAKVIGLVDSHSSPSLPLPSIINPNLVRSGFTSEKEGNNFNNPGHFFLHNLSILKEIKETEATNTLVIESVAEIEKLPPGEDRNKKVSRMIHVLHCIEALREGKIWLELSTDGRWHCNGYVSLPAEFKQTLQVDGMPLQCALDIRGCHLSFFGVYILSLNPDCCREVERWNEIFLNPEVHPIRWLSATLDIPKDDTLSAAGEVIENGLKTLMNGFLNGMGRDSSGRLLGFNPDYKNLTKIDQWFRKEFPVIYQTWCDTDIRQTGVNLSRNYETRIMQHPEIFKKADQLGVKLANEHDGVGFFAPSMEHAQAVMNEIQRVARDLFGLSIQITKKGIERHGVEHFLTDEEVKERRNREVLYLKGKKKELGWKLGKAAKLREWGRVQQFQQKRAKIDKRILQLAA